ncbi:phosphate acyltransferase, partial [uncultured Flavonifractor sp.]|uniref:phosphate acyltransferase n=1 Tax=uncultured Flavonifractor sp. TaxID=1193534 RepID=UPI00260F0806
MELKNFDEIISRVPKLNAPLRVVLAGADGENMLQGLFQAQQEGFVQPVLVGDRARTMVQLEKLGLEKEPYTMVDTAPGHNVTQAAIDVIHCGEGDILMRGNMPTRDFLMPVLDKKNGLRTERLMSHVSLASIPEYPKLLALSDMTIIVNPNPTQKKAIIKNTADALKAFGYENPKLALMALVENVNFHMPDTIEAQRLVSEQK